MHLPESWYVYLYYSFQNTWINNGQAVISSNSYFKHYIQTQSCLKNRNAWVLSPFYFFFNFFFFFGIRSPMTSKREIKWCMVADWLKCDRLLFTFCGICITSNSAKSTPRTNPSPSPSPRGTSGCLQDCRVHNSLPGAQKQHWETWRHVKLRHLAASAWINLFFF